jgi:guanylate kinase
MRDGEVEARDYFFRSKSQFRDMLERGELLESAMFCGNYYGTPRSYVESRIAEGGTVVLEIEVNGALQVKEQLSDSVLVFLMPPTFAELKRRLVSRNTEDMETVEDRLRRAREEISLIGKYDYLVINEDVDGAVADIVSIVRAEKLRPERSAPDGWDIP